MTELEAVNLARSDGEYLKEQALAAERMCAPTSCMIVLDGSMYSPSWRALAGGAAVWDAERDDLSDTDYGDDWEAYSDHLDVEMNHISDHELAGYLCWEDGCIYYCGPDYEPEG